MNTMNFFFFTFPLWWLLLRLAQYVDKVLRPPPAVPVHIKKKKEDLLFYFCCLWILRCCCLWSQWACAHRPKMLTTDRGVCFFVLFRWWIYCTFQKKKKKSGVWQNPSSQPMETLLVAKWLIVASRHVCIICVLTFDTLLVFNNITMRNCWCGTISCCFMCWLNIVNLPLGIFSWIKDENTWIYWFLLTANPQISLGDICWILPLCFPASADLSKSV